MKRQDKPVPFLEHIAPNLRPRAEFLGFVFLTSAHLFGCQVIGGLEDLKLATETGEGGNGGSGGSGGSMSASTVASSSSSSGVPIMGDITCDQAICPVGVNRACCSDHYMTNSPPYTVCVNGPPENDGCNTAGGANGYETRIECQLPAHCPPTTVCCGNVEAIAGLTWYTTLSCTTSCTWPDTVVCDPNGSSSECPMVNDNGSLVQTTCLPNNLLPLGYSVCDINP